MSDKEIERIISRNLKKIMSDNKINQNQLSKIAGVSESAVGKWVLGKSTPRMGAIQKIADHFNLPKSYILSERTENIVPISPKTSPIPVIGEIACGNPIIADENIIDYRHESIDLLPKGTLFYLKAKGDSMEPTIPDNSFVLIREQPEVEFGEIAAVLMNDETEATLKRVRKQDDFILLVPDNSEYQPVVVTHENPVKILGKAIRISYDL